MQGDLKELLIQKNFDELLRRLDDAANRQRLLAELEQPDDSDPEPASEQADQHSRPPDPQRIWDDVAAGNLRNKGDSEGEAIARELALSLGAYSPLHNWLRRLHWGQILAGSLTSAALTVALMVLVPRSPAPLQEPDPGATLLARVNSEIKPRVDDTNRASLAAVLDSYGSLQHKGTEAGLDLEFSRLLLIYEPSAEELELIRQALGLPPGAGEE